MSRTRLAPGLAVCLAAAIGVVLSTQAQSAQSRPLVAPAAALDR